MRLFVAVLPPPDALAELDAALGQPRPGGPALRWAAPPAWHLTLAFLGEAGEQILPGLHERLARAAGRHPPQRLALAGGGAFPSARRARLLWAGVAGDSRALAALAGSVAAGARRAGAPPPDEARRYRAHLTLARCREPADLSALTGQLAGFHGKAWTAGQISLVRSHLSGGPPRYEQLASWPLAGRPPR